MNDRSTAAGASLSPRALERARDTIRGLLPHEVALSFWDGDGAPSEHPEETQAVARAVEKRVLEFRRGRACARAALAQLGAPEGPIPVGAHRMPTWPAGYVGSITHCTGLVAAVAARADRIASVGLDAEPAAALPGEPRAHIVHPLDRPVRPGGVIEKVVFSAKESIFKALFPRAGIWLDFLDVAVRLDE